MGNPVNAPAGITATWLWRSPESPAAVVEFARRNGVAAIFADPSRPNIADFVVKLTQAGIATSCLGGDPRWTLDHAAAEAWCETNLRRARFAGLHIDVEPWVLPQWQTDRAATVRAYAALVERLASRFRPLNVDIAPWLFDTEPAAAARVANAGEAVTLLAYRDRASTILDFTKTARAAINKPYRIGVETQPVSLDVPKHTTFADDGAAVLHREIATLTRALAHDRNYRGVAVHHYTSWRALRP